MDERDRALMALGKFQALLEAGQGDEAALQSALSVLMARNGLREIEFTMQECLAAMDGYSGFHYGIRLSDMAIVVSQSESGAEPGSGVIIQ